MHLHKPDQKQNQYFHLLGRGTVCGIQGRRKFQKPSCSPEDKSCHCVSFKFLRLWSWKRSNRIRSWMADFECKPRQGIVTWRWCGEVWSTVCSLFPLQPSWRIWETNPCVQTVLLPKHKGFCSWLRSQTKVWPVLIMTRLCAGFGKLWHWKLGSDSSCAADSQDGSCQFSSSSSRTWRSHLPVLQNCFALFACGIWNWGFYGIWPSLHNIQHGEFMVQPICKHIIYP